MLAAAQRAGWSWPTVCEGNMECGICWAEVDEGAENLNPLQPGERAKLDEGLAARKPRARLACQVKAGGSATLTRRGAKPPKEA